MHQTTDIVRLQILAVKQAKTIAHAGVSLQNYRYVVYHYGKDITYYNYYSSKFSAYLEAINPRYWRCHTVVLLDVDNTQDSK